MRGQIFSRCASALTVSGILTVMLLLAAALYGLLCSPFPAWFPSALALSPGKRLAAAAKAIERDPRYLPALLTRGFVFLETGDLDGARRDFLLVLEQDEDEPVAHAGLGMAQLDSGDAAAAVVSLSRAVGLYPEYLKAWQAKALAHYEAGETAQGFAAEVQAALVREDLKLALSLTDDFMKRYPARTEGYEIKGNILNRMGHHLEALDHYTQVIERAPRYARIHFKRGLLHQTLHRDDSAIQDFSRALDLEPELAGARFSRAQCLLRLGDLSAALDDFFLAGRTYYQAGRTSRVAACLEPWLKAMPGASQTDQLKQMLDELEGSGN